MAKLDSPIVKNSKGNEDTLLHPEENSLYPLSYRQALEAKQEAIWKSLAPISLKEAATIWISTIQNTCTKKSYRTAIKELFQRKFLDPNWSLQMFSLILLDNIIDRIKTEALLIDSQRNQVQWSIKTREARISCLLSFTRYLSRKTEGVIRRGIPSRDGINKTFSPKARKVKTAALNRSLLICFFEELDKINSRDAMIARLCLHGAKRISEVLDLKTDQIDYVKNQIKFKQSKSKVLDDFTIINFEGPIAQGFLQTLKGYIGERKDLVFLTAKNRKVQKTQVDRNFAKAGHRAGIPFRVSPHNLRATAVTLWKEDGFSDSLIMLATGHSSSQMVHCYDKSDLADNVTRKSCLLS